MMARLLTITALLLFISPAHAQEPTPIGIAILTCVGPGYLPPGDPFEVLDTLDERYCARVCKAAVKGCKDVVKAVDKCGVNFLKSSAKVGVEICRGWGFTSSDCRIIKDEFKADIDWWKAEGKIEQAVCDADARARCFSRC